MTQVQPEIKIRLQYIRNISEIHSEVTYTSTLPLNQEGILSTQFLAQVFFSVSSGSSSSLRHLQVIFIIGSGSSLDLDHHWIWIITRSGSLLLDHHYWIWIITRSGSTLMLSHDSSRHRNLYRASSFSCWLYAYPHVGIRPALISDLLVRKARPTLTSDHVVNYNPIRKAQHSHSPV